MLKNSGPHCHHQLVNVSVNVVVLIFPNPRRTDASLVVAVDGDGWRWHRGSRCCLRRSATDKRRDGFFLTVVGVDVDDVGGVGFDATPNFRYLMRLKRGFPPASSSTTKLIWGGFNLTWNWSSEFFCLLERDLARIELGLDGLEGSDSNLALYRRPSTPTATLTWPNHFKNNWSLICQGWSSLANDHTTWHLANLKSITSLNTGSKNLLKVYQIWLTNTSQEWKKDFQNPEQRHPLSTG